MKWDRVMPGLFVGPDPREEADFDALRAVKITAILSLQTKDDLRDRGIEWEERSALRAGLTFRSVPVTDFNTADLQHKLPACVSALDGMLKAGHSVYVHCTAGVSRSPTVVAAYLHWCLGWPLRRALTHMEETRNCAPNSNAIRGAVWSALGSVE
jgi:protein-tyrosine phosphatase